MARTRHDLRRVGRRRYWRESDARVLIEAWRGSEESLAQFAVRHGVESRRLARWLKRLEGSAAPAARTVLHPVRLVERPVSVLGGGGAIELRLPDGSRVFVPPGFTTDDLRRVLAVLAESRPC